MNELYTTLQLIIEYDISKEVYSSLRTEFPTWPYTEPIYLTRILEASGLEYAVWALRAVPIKQTAVRDKLARLMACDCAERVLRIYGRGFKDDARLHGVIEAARKYALHDVAVDKLCRAAAIADAARAEADSKGQRAESLVADIVGMTTFRDAAHAAEYVLHHARDLVDFVDDNYHNEYLWQTEQFRRWVRWQ